MKISVTLEDDVAAAIDRARRERSIRLSEAVNELIRAGLLVKDEPHEFVQETSPAGLRIDLRDVADALALLEGEQER